MQGLAFYWSLAIESQPSSKGVLGPPVFEIAGLALKACTLCYNLDFGRSLGFEGQYIIRLQRMDDLNLPTFGLLKIDCEGHELEVIKGGVETIIKYKPI